MWGEIGGAEGRGGKGPMNAVWLWVVKGEGRVRGDEVPPIVGSLFSWKSLFTKRSTRDDWNFGQRRLRKQVERMHTFPTAASPSSTSLTLLLGLGGAFAESAITDVTAVGLSVGNLAR